MQLRSCFGNFAVPDNYMKKVFVFLPLLLAVCQLSAQDAMTLAQQVKAKLAKVNDYQANGTMKTDVSFMKVPESGVVIYYKKPDQFRIRKQDGITITPKGGMSVNLNGLFIGNNFTAVAAGNTTFKNTPVTIIKLLPLDEQTDVVVSTLYIDPKQLLIRKATTTTRQNGTYEMELDYGKYADWGLPDKVVFIFDTKEYKLPKGLAFDYESGSSKPPAKTVPQNSQGRIELNYSSYLINKGVPASIFR